MVLVAHGVAGDLEQLSELRIRESTHIDARYKTQNASGIPSNTLIIDTAAFERQLFRIGERPTSIVDPHTSLSRQAGTTLSLANLLRSFGIDTSEFIFHNSGNDAFAALLSLQLLLEPETKLKKLKRTNDGADPVSPKQTNDAADPVSPKQTNDADPISPTQVNNAAGPLSPKQTNNGADPLSPTFADIPTSPLRPVGDPREYPAMVHSEPAPVAPVPPIKDASPQPTTKDPQIATPVVSPKAPEAAAPTRGKGQRRGKGRGAGKQTG